VISSRKAALSLLISVLLFAGFTALAFTGLFDLVETRFYNPAVVRAIDREIDADTRVIEEFLQELQGRFAATLENGAVRRSFLSGQESGDIALRSSLYGELLESLGGLQSVRFIGSDGVRIHFSTWPPDILRQDEASIAYRNYNAAVNSAAYIPYGQVEAAESLGLRLILDEVGERIVFSLPFYDSFNLSQGTALFSLSIRAVIDRMTAAGRIKIGEDISVISEPPGIIIGLPPTGRNTLLPLISRVWSENSLSLGALNSGLTGASLALVSRKAAYNIYTGRLVDESLLSFPPAMRIILLASFFTTLFLIIFLIFNIRQDDIAVIQSRLQKLQINLLEEYYEHKGDVDWNRLKKDLEQRRDDVHAELKRGLKPRTRDLVEIDSFIDKSWDDLTAIIGSRVEKQAGIDEARRKALIHFQPEPPAPLPDKAPEPGEPESAEPAELEALDEAEEPEPGEPDPAKPAKIEALDDAEEPELVEPLDMAEFYGLNPFDLENLEESDGMTINNPASVLEFSPEPEELEREKEEAARSMAEHLEIQSPFTAIFSTLAEVGFEPEPMESLESLEKAWQAPDNSPETAAEELKLSFTGFQLSVPFLTTLNNEITLLEAEDDGEAPAAPDTEGATGTSEPEQAAAAGDAGTVITEKDGVIYIDESVRAPGKKPLKGLNKSLKNLIDSILNNT
jgi:hypothetical protein